MAEPLARSEAIRLLERAAGLIRQVPSGFLITHWIGSVPFALAMLFSWSRITNTRTTDAVWAVDSLVLALLLLWMNCCRTVYAGRLRRYLSSVPDAPLTVRRVVHLCVIQSFFGATKLLALPFCLLILFPWAKTVAFYRTLAVVADREEITARQAMAQAHRLAGFKPAQNWLILALLILLQVVVTLNLAIVLGVLPQIVRILTGYESAYSRSGIYFVFNPTFLLLVLAVSWLAFDPFAQAVYCLRSFEAESTKTGENLRCGLRRIRVSAQVATLLLLIVAAPRARADVSPSDLGKSVQQAEQAPEYDWRFPPAPAAANTPWIVEVVDRMAAAFRRAADAVGDAIERFFKWLKDRLLPKGSSQSKGAPPGAGLDWTVTALIALVVCAGVLFAWQRQRRRSSRPQTKASESRATVRLDAPDLAPDALPEDQWLELAERSMAEQNFRFALRALYLASLAWLGRREVLSIHPGKTNHEYENELNRRTRAVPAVRGLFAGNVAAFERAWYGVHAVSGEEAMKFRQRSDELKAALTGGGGLIP